MCGGAGVAFLVLICILIALVVSILGFVPENEVPPDVPKVVPQTPLR
ncbi:exopeptide [Sinorhizobium medicae]|nr:exopeptide [Sinorhizobium medicae]MDW9646311.1 exopeptide [Sinorhizobium meliloti]MDX0415214.1 exopeptide [Sinorhizobium medicae]MDX0470259.1 exopeptide [Sinorhizobium medicae]MDX0476315.1 exopeptide [Sinorhizobium medicae]MDX0901491.1 exopeptide [Sinorhizobium medicae]